MSTVYTLRAQVAELDVIARKALELAKAKSGETVHGVGVPGRNGTNGRDGRDGAVGPDSTKVLAEARATITAMRSDFAALRRDFETLSLAFTTSSKKSAEYIEFLREKTRAGLKK